MASNPTHHVPWTTVEDTRLGGSPVVLLRHAFALSWAHFLYAQGDDAEVRAFWTTHELVIKGSGLRSLLEELASQRLEAIFESPRASRFGQAGPMVAEIDITKLEED